MPIYEIRHDKIRERRSLPCWGVFVVGPGFSRGIAAFHDQWDAERLLYSLTHNEIGRAS